MFTYLNFFRVDFEGFCGKVHSDCDDVLVDEGLILECFGNACFAHATFSNEDHFEFVVAFRVVAQWTEHWHGRINYTRLESNGDAKKDAITKVKLSQKVDT